MAVRVPKFLRQLFDALGVLPSSGSFLRWNDTRLENVTPFQAGIGDWERLGIYVGQVQPDLHPSYEAWVAAGRTGYWGFIESSGELAGGSASITSTGGIVQLIGGIPTIAITTVQNASVQASAAVLQLIGGVPQVSSVLIGSQSVFPSSATIQVVGGVPAIVVTSPIADSSIVTVGGTITVVGGVPSVVAGAASAYRNDFSNAGTLSDFTQVAGTWSITSSTLRATANTPGVYQKAHYGALSTQDGVIEAPIWFNSTAVNGAALVARYVDENNYVLVFVDRAAGTINVAEYKDGAPTGAGGSWSKGSAITNLQNHGLRVEFSGNSIIVKFDENTLVPTTTRVTVTTVVPPWSGVCAMWSLASSTTGARFDRVLISTNPSEAY